MSDPQPASAQVDANRVIRNLAQKLSELEIENATLQAVISELMEQRNADAKTAEDAAIKKATESAAGAPITAAAVATTAAEIAKAAA